VDDLRFVAILLFCFHLKFIIYPDEYLLTKPLKDRHLHAWWKQHIKRKKKKRTLILSLSVVSSVTSIFILLPFLIVRSTWIGYQRRLY